MSAPTEVVEQAAAVVYEAVRGLGLTNGEIGIVTWQIVPEDVKAAYRAGVRKVLAGADPEGAHAAWRSDMLALGWKPGPAYDLARREHPLLCAFQQLSELQRFKYTLFAAVARCFEHRVKSVK